MEGPVFGIHAMIRTKEPGGSTQTARRLRHSTQSWLGTTGQRLAKYVPGRDGARVDSHSPIHPSIRMRRALEVRNKNRLRSQFESRRFLSEKRSRALRNSDGERVSPISRTRSRSSLNKAGAKRKRRREARKERRSRDNKKQCLANLDSGHPIQRQYRSLNGSTIGPLSLICCRTRERSQYRSDGIGNAGVSCFE